MGSIEFNSFRLVQFLRRILKYWYSFSHRLTCEYSRLFRVELTPTKHGNSGVWRNVLTSAKPNDGTRFTVSFASPKDSLITS